jgi:hypothetical protein
MFEKMELTNISFHPKQNSSYRPKPIISMAAATLYESSELLIVATYMQKRRVMPGVQPNIFAQS